MAHTVCAESADVKGPASFFFVVSETGSRILSTGVRYELTVFKWHLATLCDEWATLDTGSCFLNVRGRVN